MQSLTVSLGERSYPVFIGEHLVSNANLFIPYIQGKKVVIVTNQTIAPLYLTKVKMALSDYSLSEVILPDGEQWKTMETLTHIFDHLMSRKCDRTTTLIALGGGVVGDITGFAAACYRRGVNFIQIPTTLLSQVDSSVGGKTAVNHPLGKNMIGSFYQPVCVFADIELLTTLPEREFQAGMAEVIKYGLICDVEFYKWLLDNTEKIQKKEPEKLMEMVYRCCHHKAKIVEKDEKENSRRAILNLGHTFGHAIETEQQYKGLLHGEAVAVGMMMAMELSSELGYLDVAEKYVLEKLLKKFKLPTTIPAEINRKSYCNSLLQDKKVNDGRLRLVLLKGIGDAFVTSAFDQDKVNATIFAFFRSK